MLGLILHCDTRRKFCAIGDGSIILPTEIDLALFLSIALIFTHMGLTRQWEVATVSRASCPATHRGGRDQEIAPTEDVQ